jgi:hypothetical protein
MAVVVVKLCRIVDFLRSKTTFWMVLQEQNFWLSASLPLKCSRACANISP